jgi:hypothetical protein
MSNGSSSGSLCSLTSSASREIRRIRGLGVRVLPATSAHQGENKSLHDARMPSSIAEKVLLVTSSSCPRTPTGSIPRLSLPSLVQEAEKEDEP